MTDSKAEPSQPDKFRELARQLEADASEERFEATVRRIASSPLGEPQSKSKLGTKEVD